MNCKPGDLAVVVRSHAANEGRIVRCLRFVPRQRFNMPDGEREMPAWEVDTPMRSWTGRMTMKAPDEFLRPIRPGDISDEEVRDLYAPKLPETANT